MTYGCVHRASRLHTLCSGWIHPSSILMATRKRANGQVQRWSLRIQGDQELKPSSFKQMQAPQESTATRRLMTLPSGRLQQQEMFLLNSVRRVFTWWSERLVKGSSKTRASELIDEREQRRESVQKPIINATWTPQRKSPRYRLVRTPLLFESSVRQIPGKKPKVDSLQTPLL